MIIVARLTIALCLLVAAVPAFAQWTADQANAVDRVIAEELEAQKIPGLSAAIAVEGMLRLSKGYGYADLENEVRATDQTRYRLGSISKAITAVAVMQLAEAGKLDLDAPVQKYVPSFPEKRQAVTSRLLLGHLGGVRHYKNAEEVGSTRHYSNLTEPLAIFQDDPLVAPPGTKYSYTTYGYNLLGAVVEAASGERFVDYLRKKIFEPAGMATIADDNVYRIIPHRTRGYRKAESGEIENCALADTSNKIPGGGMISDAADLVRFALAVRDGRLLKPETVAAMWTQQTLADGSKTTYGLGWFVVQGDGPKRVGHSGGQQGTSTLLTMLPETGAVVVVMANLERSNVGRVVERIVEAAGLMR
jgi:CubicO group peptidase (beta-lactamase class C family)